MRVNEGGSSIDVKATVKAVAIGRIGLGLSYLVLPGASLRLWPGRASSSERDAALLRLMARHTGGRDIGIGLGALLALQHDAPVRGWLEAAMLADTVDAVAILFAFRHLPRTRALLMLGAALGTAAAGRRLATSVG